MMAGIRGKDTKPERIVRSILHRAGFRFRLHVADLPGKPDIVLPKWRTVVFVHGCFWHGHECAKFRWPATRRSFWREKIQGNRVRDDDHFRKLIAAGWRVAVVWECAVQAQTGPRLERIATQLTNWVRSRKGRSVVVPAIEKSSGTN